jgi:LCP family protein required for cell wall assembly
LRVETSHARRATTSATYLTATLTGIAVLIAVVAFSAAGFLISGRGSGTAAGFIRAQPGSVAWNERDRFTMLVVLAPAGSGQRSPAEAMMILSFDPASRSLSELSIPGTLWVTVPGYGQTEIDNAYADGGIRLTLLTVESATHVAIPYYMVTGGGGFRRLIDAFGGVRLAHVSPSTGQSRGNQPAGHSGQPIDGAAALAFARESVTGEARALSEMRRFQEIVGALAKQGVSGARISSIPSVISQIGGSLSTNFPLNQVSDLAQAASRVPAGRTNVTQLDFADRAVTAYGSGLLLPDLQRIDSIAQSLFPYHPAGPQLVVLNGTGISGQAASVAGYLSRARVPIQSIGSAPSYGYPHTEIVIRAGAGAAAGVLAREAASLLQAPIVTGSVRSARSPVVLIVGGDYQDLTQP